MSRRNERSWLFFLICFAFSVLLLSGGARLIGSRESEKAVPIQAQTIVRAAWISAPAPREETGAPQQRGQSVQRQETAAVPESPVPHRPEACDANGHVLKSRSYLRTVYQAFTLGDGFV